MTACPHCSHRTIGFWARWWSDSACPVRCPKCAGWSYISRRTELILNGLLNVLPFVGVIASLASNSLWPVAVALGLTAVVFWYLVHTATAVPLSDAQAAQNRRWGNVVMFGLFGGLLLLAVVTGFANAL